MFQPLALRGGAFFGVDHSLAGFRDKRNREARDEDLLANLKVRNKTFAQIAAYGNSTVEPDLKLKTMVADVSQKIQEVLDAVNVYNATMNTDPAILNPNRLNLSNLSEKWNQLVRAVNPYLTGPNNQLMTDEDSNQLKQMITNQLQVPINQLKTSIAAKAQNVGLALGNLGQFVINHNILFGQGMQSIVNQIEDKWYLPVAYGPQVAGPPGLAPPAAAAAAPFFPGGGEDEDEDEDGPEPGRPREFPAQDFLRMPRGPRRLDVHMPDFPIMPAGWDEPGVYPDPPRGREEEEEIDPRQRMEQRAEELADQQREDPRIGQRADDEVKRKAFEVFKQQRALLVQRRAQMEEKSVKLQDKFQSMAMRAVQNREERDRNARLRQLFAENRREMADVAQEARQLENVNFRQRETLMGAEHAIEQTLASAQEKQREIARLMGERSELSAKEQATQRKLDEASRKISELERKLGHEDEEGNRFFSPEASRGATPASAASARSASENSAMFQEAARRGHYPPPEIPTRNVLSPGAAVARPGETNLLRRGLNWASQKAQDVLSRARAAPAEERMLTTPEMGIRQSPKSPSPAPRPTASMAERFRRLQEGARAYSPVWEESPEAEPPIEDLNPRSPEEPALREHNQRMYNDRPSIFKMRNKRERLVTLASQNNLPSVGSRSAEQIVLFLTENGVRIPDDFWTRPAGLDTAMPPSATEPRRSSRRGQSPGPAGGPAEGHGKKKTFKTDYSGPMETIMEEPKTPRPKRSVGSAKPSKRKLPKESYQGFNDMANEGFGMYGRAAPMQSKTDLMMTENAHMPILTGNKGLPKIYGMENKLKSMGYYKPKY